jgi:hypothetical protein
MMLKYAYVNDMSESSVETLTTTRTAATPVVDERERKVCDSTFMTRRTKATPVVDERECKVCIPQFLPVGNTNPMGNFERNVRFSLESNKIFPVTNINDMDEEDIRKTWYTQGELYVIKKKSRATIRKLIRGPKLEKNSKQTGRGLLEYQTPQRSFRCLNAFNAVLEEQRRQRKDGIQNDELLAEAHKSASSTCQHAAYAQGLLDEAEIKSELEQMKRKYCRKNTSSSQSVSHGMEASLRIISELASSKLPGCLDSLYLHL